MTSPASVLEQLTDILVRVVACPPTAVVPDATLKELGTDSLTVVEVAEELGRRFDVYLSDDVIDHLVTVGDAVDAVVHHDGSVASSDAGRVTTTFASPPPPPRDDLRRGIGSMARMVLLFVFLGAGLGALFGFGSSALIKAAGIGSVDFPPISAATTPTPTEKSTAPEPAETTPTPERDEPKPTIETSADRVSPGVRFTLSGAFPAAGEGTALQVQVKDKGQEWDDFPIETTTRGGGKFKTEIFTSRPGERQFRLTDKANDSSTPAVTVEIG